MAVRIEKGGWILIGLIGVGLVGYALKRYGVLDTIVPGAKTTESTVPHTCVDALNLEARFSPATQEGLRHLGHPVQVIGPWAAVGSAMLIQHDPATGVLHGGADPRRDGSAVGW